MRMTEAAKLFSIDSEELAMTPCLPSVLLNSMDEDERQLLEAAKEKVYDNAEACAADDAEDDEGMPDIDLRALCDTIDAGAHSSDEDESVSSAGQRTVHCAVRTHPTEKLGAWIRGNSITNVVAGCPAERAGLAVGMRIVEVNGEPTDAAETSSTVRRLWREEGEVSFKVEIASRSKRSLAKSRARRRQRALAKETTKKSEAGSAPPSTPPTPPAPKAAGAAEMPPVDAAQSVVPVAAGPLEALLALAQVQEQGVCAQGVPAVPASVAEQLLALQQGRVPVADPAQMVQLDQLIRNLSAAQTMLQQQQMQIQMQMRVQPNDPAQLQAQLNQMLMQQAQAQLQQQAQVQAQAVSQVQLQIQQQMQQLQQLQQQQQQVAAAALQQQCQVLPQAMPQFFLPPQQQ